MQFEWTFLPFPPEVGAKWRKLLCRYQGEEGMATFVLVLNRRTHRGELFTGSRLETNILMRVLWKLWLRQEEDEQRMRERR